MTRGLEPLDHVTAEVIINDIDDYTSPEHVGAKDALAILREIDHHLQLRIKVLAETVEGSGEPSEMIRGVSPPRHSDK
jgi:hypothetical protein